MNTRRIPCGEAGRDQGDRAEATEHQVLPQKTNTEGIWETFRWETPRLIHSEKKKKYHGAR